MFTFINFYRDEWKQTEKQNPLSHCTPQAEDYLNRYLILISIILYSFSYRRYSTCIKRRAHREVYRAITGLGFKLHPAPACACLAAEGLEGGTQESLSPQMEVSNIGQFLLLLELLDIKLAISEQTFPTILLSPQWSGITSRAVDICLHMKILPNQ